MNSKIELTTVLQALKVAEHRSFRRAAGALGVCQSSISKRVRKLEELLGVDLFDRHHAGVTVTDAGRQFFEHIKMALDHLDSAVTSAGMAGRVEKGSLKIGLFCSLASGFLPELLRSYSAKHPEIDVSIVEGQPSENLARLRADELDIVFVMGQPSERDCDVAKLWSERVFVVLPDTHALCGKDAIDWEDLKTEHFILTRTEIGVMVRDYVIRRLSALHQRPDVRQSPVARDTLVHLVGLGQGISLMNEANRRHALSACLLSPDGWGFGCGSVQWRLASAQQQPGSAPVHQPRPHALENMGSDRQIYGGRLCHDASPSLERKSNGLTVFTLRPIDVA
jgi:DNA-binding transcriptional LysR family regulator